MHQTEDLIEKARAFAIVAHGEQRYGAKPYVAHLDDVRRYMAWILTYCQSARYFSSKIALASAYLHDVLEDTNIGASRLAQEFGADMAFLIIAVTDEPGENRKERKEKTYPKILQLGPMAVALKLADRMANTQVSSKGKDPALFEMYRKEYPAFKAALKREGQGLDNMWEYLDEEYA